MFEVPYDAKTSETTGQMVQAQTQGDGLPVRVDRLLQAQPERQSGFRSGDEHFPSSEREDRGAGRSGKETTGDLVVPCEIRAPVLGNL